MYLRPGPLASGMLVCAIYPADNRWYRARVVDASTSHDVTVYFVDYGNQAKADWKDIAKLVDKFMELPEMVS